MLPLASQQQVAAEAAVLPLASQQEVAAGAVPTAR